MANQRLVKTLGLTILIAILLRVAISRPYRGTIVDAEAGQPLAGAVVALVWCKYPIVETGWGYTFHSAKEAVTDSDGRFSMNGWRGVDWNPLTLVQAPEIVISLVGYHPVNEVSRLSLPEDLAKGRVIGLTVLPPGKDHDCGNAFVLCANDESLFSSCRPSAASVPLLAASLRAQ